MIIHFISEWQAFTNIRHSKLVICFQILLDLSLFLSLSPPCVFAFSAQASRWYRPALRKLYLKLGKISIQCKRGWISRANFMQSVFGILLTFHPASNVLIMITTCSSVSLARSLQQTNKQTKNKKQINKQTDRQTNRETNTQTNTLRNKQTKTWPRPAVQSRRTLARPLQLLS